MSKPVFLEVQSFILKDFPLNGDVMIMMQGRIDTLFFFIPGSTHCCCCQVIITGTFLKNKDIEKCNWSCMFGEIEVPAHIIADGTLCCHAPPHKAGRIPFYVTCSNRLACSEVREFEYRECNTRHMKTSDFYGSRVNERDLYIRLEKLLSLSSEQPKPASRISSDKQHLLSEINSLMIEVEDEWFNMLTPRQEKAFSSDSAQDRLLEKLLKDKLHVWLLYKVVEDGKGPSVLDEEGQGVLHLAAALGYDWAITPTITAGASVNFRDVHGWTALHWAAFCGRYLSSLYILFSLLIKLLGFS